MTIIIKTKLAAAIARWADSEHGHKMSAVVFRDGVVCATNGRFMCTVPVETHGHEFGVCRRDLLSAIAAQDVMARGEYYPQIAHDLEVISVSGAVGLTDGPHGDRELNLTCTGDDVRIDLGGIALHAPAADISTYPTTGVVDMMPSTKSRAGSPDGYLLQPAYLAEVERINNATAGYDCGVHVVSWGRVGEEGARDAIVMHGETGARFAIMPMRDVKGSK